MVGTNIMENGEEFSVNSSDEKEKGENEDQFEEYNEEELVEEPEMKILNDQIDQLNSCLDRMERQNDVLKAELLELLETNRKTRQELAEDREQVETVESLSLDKTSDQQK